MATSADMNNSTPHPDPRSTAVGLFGGLAWGALMLVVFGFWIRDKYDHTRPIITNIFLLAGAVTAALAIWQAFTLWIKNETPAQRSASLGQQARLLSYALLVGGLGLIVMACVLGIGKKPGGGDYGFLRDNFAESFGVLLFGLIALFAGYALQLPGGEGAAPIRFLVDKVPVLKMGQLVIVILCIITLIWFVAAKRDQFMTYITELTALLFLSMLSLGCFLYLNTGKFEETDVRKFVLIYGGSVGLILFFLAIARAIVWRQDILLGGSVAWQGPEAWKFWLVAYLLFAALALMYFSFNLGRTDIRKDVVLRRLMYGYDAVVQMLLLVGVLFIFNIVIYALYPFTFEWTKNRGAYALADSSKNLIANLKQETHVFVLIPQGTLYYKDVRHLLDNCSALSPKLDVKYISPDADRGPFMDLARKFPSIFPEGRPADDMRGVLLVYGAMPANENDKSAHAFVPERKLVEFEAPRGPGERTKYVFKGEGEILKEIQFLADKQKKRKLYVLQGEGAVDLENMETRIERRSLKAELSQIGIGLFAEQLGRDNYEIAGLNFGTEIPGEKTRATIVYVKEGTDKKKDVPEDCETLIVAGIAKTLPKETLDAIDRYMERGGPSRTGGKMVVFLDCFVDTEGTKLRNNGIEDLLKKYGVEVTNDVLLRIPDQERDDPRMIKATPPQNSENQLAKQFIGDTLYMKRGARVVRSEPGMGRFKAETLLELGFRPNEGRAGIVVKDVKGLIDPAYMDELDKAGKLRALFKPEAYPVAVAVSDGTGAPRLVVFGDTEFVTNREIAIANVTRAPNYDMAVSSIDWMAGRESLGAKPRQSDFYSVKAETPFWRMVLLPGWFMLIGFVSLGIVIWVVRRR